MVETVDVMRILQTPIEVRLEEVGVVALPNLMVVLHLPLKAITEEKDLTG